MLNALSDVLVMLQDGKVLKVRRVGLAQAQGKTVGQLSTGSIETKARAIGRASVIGFTQLDKWRENILGRGELQYLITSGALARLWIVPAMRKWSVGDRLRNTRIPGTGFESPFAKWERISCHWALNCHAFIERTSFYGKDVGEERPVTIVVTPKPGHMLPWEKEGGASRAIYADGTG